MRHLSGVMTPTKISYSIPSATVACNHQSRSRRAVANVRLLVAALVVGILPMLRLIRTVKGFHGVHLTLLTSQSSIPTLMLNRNKQSQLAVPATSQYLLEINLEAEEQIFTSVSYWVLAMKAALKEKIIANKRN